MRCCLVLCLAGILTAADPPGAGVLQAMKTELDRSMREFQKQPLPAYYLSYEVTETATTRVASSFGTLSGSASDRRRELDIDLRVGDHTVDNTHKIRGSMDPFMDLVMGGGSIPVPLDEDAAAIRAILWYHTDQRYRRAVERLKSIQTNLKTKAENTDKAGDFSKAPAVRAMEPYTAPAAIDRSAWEAKVRKYTEPFRRFGNIYQATADLSFTSRKRRAGSFRAMALRCRPCSPTTACPSAPGAKRRTAWSCRAANSSSPPRWPDCPTTPLC
jgi:hypothetical protein